MILKAKENKEPIIGINPIKPKMRSPRITARSEETCFPPKALQMLSPRKWKTTTRPKILMMTPIAIRAKRIGMPIRMKERKTEKTMSPVKMMMLKRPIPETGQKDVLI